MGGSILQQCFGAGCCGVLADAAPSKQLAQDAPRLIFDFISEACCTYCVVTGRFRYGVMTRVLSRAARELLTSDSADQKAIACNAAEAAATTAAAHVGATLGDSIGAQIGALFALPLCISVGGADSSSQCAVLLRHWATREISAVIGAQWGALLCSCRRDVVFSCLSIYTSAVVHAALPLMYRRMF